MYAFIDALASVLRQAVGEVLGERAKHRDEKAAFWRRVVDVFGDRSKRDAILGKGVKGLERDHKVPGPAIEGVNDNDIVGTFLALRQEPLEGRPLVNRFRASGAAFVYEFVWFTPTLADAVFEDAPLLRGKAQALDLFLRTDAGVAGSPQDRSSGWSWPP